MGFFRFPYSIADVFGTILSKDQSARMDERDRAIEDYLSADAPAAPAASTGGVIAYMTYSPVGSTYSQAIPSGGIAAIDAGFRLKVTFTVPASGSVLVEMEAVVHPSVYNATCNWLVFALKDAGTSSIIASAFILGDTTLLTANSSDGLRRVRAVIPVTGLTPGDSVTYHWAADQSMSSGSLSLQARAYDGVSGDDVAGPLFMAVHSLP